MVTLFSTTLFLFAKRLSKFFPDNATVGAVTDVTKCPENHSKFNITRNFNSTLRFQNYVLYFICATLFDISLCKIVDQGSET